MDVEKSLGRFGGRVDVRGIRFPEPTRQGAFDFHGLDIELVHRLEFKRLDFESYDFSLASLNGVMFSKCSFDRCLFQRTHLAPVLAYGCEFRNCRFVDCDLTGAVLGGKVGRDSGRIIDTEFRGGKFVEVVFSFPVITGCLFGCDIIRVDFDGSQLTDCRFMGKLDKVFFRRRTVDGVRFSRTIPENKMENVDFSEADLLDVDFRGGVDLTKCIFPSKPGTFLVLDGPRVFAKVRKEIVSSWNGEDRRIGLGYTDYLMDDIKEGQRHFLVDEEHFVESWGESLGRRYATIVRSVAKSLGALRELD